MHLQTCHFYLRYVRATEGYDVRISLSKENTLGGWIGKGGREPSFASNLKLYFGVLTVFLSEFSLLFAATDNTTERRDDKVCNCY